MKTELNLEVEFGGVSIGDETARMGIKVDRQRLPLDVADGCLCGKRLTGAVQLGTLPPDQNQLDGMDDAFPRIASTFDVKRFGVAPKELSFGLTFSLGEIDVSELSKFAKRKGRLVIDNVEALPESSRGDDDDDDDDGPEVDDHPDVGPRARVRPTRHNPRQQEFVATAGDPLREIGLSSLGIAAAVAEKLDAEGIRTVPQLELAMREGRFAPGKIRGIGEVAIRETTALLHAAREKHPLPEAPPAADAADLPPFTCRCTGEPATWTLSEQHIADFGKEFPALDIRKELLYCISLLEQDPAKRKTVKGTPALLRTWLKRAAAQQAGQSTTLPAGIRAFDPDADQDEHADEHAGTVLG